MVNPEPSEEEPPFPWMAMSALCVGMLGHSVAFTSPLPYVAFMVVDFGMVDNLDEAGYYAGWITGAFMIGRTIASLPWGVAADKWGRKPCLLLSMFNVAVLGLWFGFSSSFTMAVVLRFLVGLGNGFMCVAKTCVSEIVETKDHELKGFGYLNSIWGLGLIVGPALGGLLSRVSVQYPGSVSDDSIWAKYPYLLPSVVCSLIACVSFAWVLISLKETLGQSRVLITNEEWKRRRALAVTGKEPKEETEDRSVEMIVVNPMKMDSSVSISTSKDSSSNSSSGGSQSKWGILGSLGEKQDKKGFQPLPSEDDEDVENGNIPEQGRPSQSEGRINDANTSQDGEEEQHLVSSESGNSDETTPDLENQKNLVDSCDSCSTTVEGSTRSSSPTSPSPKAAKPKTMKEILMDWDCQILFTIYMTFRFLIMFIDECFPLWALTSLEHGGLAWESAQVGEVLACVGVALIIFQLFLFQPMMKRYFPHGPTDTYAKLCYICAISAAMVPFAAYFGLHVIKTDSADASRKNYVLFVSVMIFMMFFRVSLGSAFTTLSVVVNNSVDQSMRGTMNGLIMTAGSVGNTLGPIVGAICYAASLSIPQFLPYVPVDGRMMFIFGGIMSTGVGLFARRFLVVD